MHPAGLLTDPHLEGGPKGAVDSGKVVGDGIAPGLWGGYSKRCFHAFGPVCVWGLSSGCGVGTLVRSETA